MPIILCGMCCWQPHQIELKFRLQFHVDIRCPSRGSNLLLPENMRQIGRSSIQYKQIKYRSRHQSLMSLFKFVAWIHRARPTPGSEWRGPVTMRGITCCSTNPVAVLITTTSTATPTVPVALPPTSSRARLEISNGLEPRSTSYNEA